MQEIKESEKKLKIISMLHVVSASRGEISLKNFIVQTNKESDFKKLVLDDVMQDLMTGLDGCDRIELTDSETQSLVFIAGYVGHKLVNRVVSCDICKNELVCDRTLQYDL